MLHRNLMIEALDLVLAQDVPAYELPEAITSQIAAMSRSPHE